MIQDRLQSIDCNKTTTFEASIKYLSRYLYKSVVSDKNIISNQQGQVTFTYINSETGLCSEKWLNGLNCF